MATGSTLSRFAALTPEARSKELANRGKGAESAVEDRLELLAKYSKFAWERYPDARAGSRKEALADYLISNCGRLVLLEVKEVNHKCRLPHGNFTVSQVARMRRYKMAGAQSIVLVYFTPEKMWRGTDIDYFINREGGSWKMSDLPLKTLEELLGYADN